MIPEYERGCNLRRRGSSLKRAILKLLLGIAMLCAHTALALPQMSGVPPIRVESGEVLVPTIVELQQNYASVSGLTVADFQVFEDGKAQKIQQVTLERNDGGVFLDNFGIREYEGSSTPGQKWALILREPIPHFVWNTGPSHADVYLLAYVPPDSAEGSCHEIKVKVDRKDTFAVARDEYCNTPHVASDPLAGTSLGKQMEDIAGSDGPTKISLTLQTGFLYTNAKTARVYVTAEFPSSDIRYLPVPHGLRYEIACLTLAYRANGSLLTHFSDLLKQNFPILSGEDMPQFYSQERRFIPDHHETQAEATPGRLYPARCPE